MKKNIPLILNSLATVFVAVVLLFAFLNFSSAPEKRGLFGYKGFIVLSDSMAPEFVAGDYIIDKTVPFETLKVGDVVSYLDDQNVLVTHRVHEVSAEGLLLKGDRNDFIDTTVVNEGNYVGKQQYKVHKLGLIMLKLGQPIVLVGISFVLGIYLLYHFFKKR